MATTLKDDSQEQCHLQASGRMAHAVLCELHVRALMKSAEQVIPQTVRVAKQGVYALINLEYLHLQGADASNRSG